MGGYQLEECKNPKYLSVKGTKLCCRIIVSTDILLCQ